VSSSPRSLGSIASKLRSRHARRIGIGAVGVAVIVATFVFVLPRIADYRDVWAVVKDLSWPQIAVLVAVTALNLATYAPPWQAALPGLSFRNAFVLSMSSSASTYLAPGGPAVGVALSYGMLRSWGFRRQDVTLAVALTGTWNGSSARPSEPRARAPHDRRQHHALLKTVALIALGVFVIAAASTAPVSRAVGSPAGPGT
jgi:hypothetical protein